MAPGIAYSISFFTASWLGGIAATSMTCVQQACQGLWRAIKNNAFLYFGKHYRLVEEDFSELQLPVH